MEFNQFLNMTKKKEGKESSFSKTHETLERLLMSVGLPRSMKSKHIEALKYNYIQRNLLGSKISKNKIPFF